MLTTRREFGTQMLASLTAYGLIETLFTRDLLADSVKPVIEKWMVELQTLCQDLKGQKLKDVEFQAKLEELYKQVRLEELTTLLKVEDIAKNPKAPDHGVRSVGVDLTRVEGLPGRIVFGKQIFIAKKGRSVVPHGHNNMCTGFVILKGEFHGRHYDRLEDRKDGTLLIKPTLDRRFKPGEFSTVSDHKDNIHWFTSESDLGLIFNIHVMNYDPSIELPTGRVYVDPEGEKREDGLIVAKRMSSSECHKKFG